MPRDGIFAQVPEGIRVGIKIAAVQERKTVRELVTQILYGWLAARTGEQGAEEGGQGL